MKAKYLLMMVALAHTSVAISVPGSGIGSSCKEAVEDAELDALKSTGNMVMHSSNAQDGKYTSSTRQYASGRVNKRTSVTCTRDGDIYRADVDVDINPGKENTLVVEPAATDDTWIKDYQANRENVQKQRTFVNGFAEMPTVAVTLDTMNVRVLGRQTEYRIKYKATWQPKLIVDVQAYAELSGVEVKAPPSRYPYSLCFGSYRNATTDKCFGLQSTIPGLDAAYVVKLKAKQGKALIEQQHVLADQKMRFVSNRGTLLFRDGFTEGEFLLYVDTEEPVTVESISVESYRPPVFR